MLKDIFSLGVYKDTLNKIKISAIVIFALVLISSVGGAFLALAIPTFAVFSLYDFIGSLVSYVVFVTPFLTYGAFSYMTRRAEADFYDALPHRRATLLISVSLAVFTVTSVTILSTVILTSLVALIFSSGKVIIFSGMALYIIGLILISFLVISISAFALGISGSLSTFVFTAPILMFAPRFIMSIINGAVYSSLPFVSYYHVLPLFNNSYNMLFGLIEGERIFSQPIAYFYTLLLGALYFLLAIYSHNARRSEWAGVHGIQNPIIRNIVKFLCALTISVVGIRCLTPAEFNFGLLVIAIILFAISILVFFIYDPLTKRNFKDFTVSLKLFPVFIVLTASLFGVITLGNSALTSFTPSEDEVKYVSLRVPENNSGLELEYYGGISFTEYVTLKCEDIKITDKEVIKAVTDSLKSNVLNYKDGRFGSEYESGQKNYVRMTFKISTGVSSAYRTVYVERELAAAIYDSFKSDEKYDELWTSLPKNPGYVEVNSYEYEISENDKEDIYNTLLKEISDMGYEAWMNTVMSGTVTDYRTVTFYDSEYGTFVSVPLYSSLENTIKSVDNAEQNAFSKAKSEALEIIDDIIEKGDADNDYEINMHIGIAGENNVEHLDFEYIDEFGEEYLTFLKNCLSDTRISNSEDEKYQSWVYVNIFCNNDYTGIYLNTELSDFYTEEEIFNFFEKYKQIAER